MSSSSTPDPFYEITRPPDAGDNASVNDSEFAVAMIVVVAIVLTVVIIGLLFLRNYNKNRKSAKAIHTISTEEEMNSRLKIEEWNTQDGKVTEETSDCCDLCSKPFRARDQVCKSYNEKCPHVFHKECLTHWLLLQNTCPTCNKVYMVQAV